MGENGIIEHVFGRRKGRFPTFPVIILVIAVIWLLNDLKVIAVDVPWIPVVLIVIAIGIIFNRYR